MTKYLSHVLLLSIFLFKLKSHTKDYHISCASVYACVRDVSVEWLNDKKIKLISNTMVTTEDRRFIRWDQESRSHYAKADLPRQENYLTLKNFIWLLLIYILNSNVLFSHREPSSSSLYLVNQCTD